MKQYYEEDEPDHLRTKIYKESETNSVPLLTRIKLRTIKKAPKCGKIHRRTIKEAVEEGKRISLNNCKKLIAEGKKLLDTARAIRHNQGKPQLSYLDLNCLTPCVQVLEFGAKKYSRDNWKKGMPVSQILDSLLRHIAAIQRGEVIDPESGLPHIGHLQCNAMFLGNLHNEQDIKVLK